MCSGLSLSNGLHMGCLGKIVRTLLCSQRGCEEVWRAVEKYKGDLQSNISKFHQRGVRTLETLV